MQNIINILKIPQTNEDLTNKRFNKLYKIDDTANSFNVFSENIFATSLNNDDEEEFNVGNLEEEAFQPILNISRDESNLRTSNVEEDLFYPDLSGNKNDNDMKKFKFSDRPDTQFAPQRSSFSNSMVSPLARPRSSSGILSHQKQLISTQIYCFGRVEIQLDNYIFILVPEQYYNINPQQLLQNKQEIVDNLYNYQLKNGSYLIVSGIQQNVKNGDIVKFELQPFQYEVTTFQHIKEQQGLFEIYAQNIDVIQQLDLQLQHKQYFIEGNTYQGIVYSYNEKDNFGFIKSVGEHKQSNSLSQGLELYFKSSQSRPKNQVFQIGDLVTFKCHWMNDRPQARDIILSGSCINQNLHSIILSITQNHIICQLIKQQPNELLNQNLIFIKKRQDVHKDNMSQSSCQSQFKSLQIGQQVLINTTVDISGQLKATQISKIDNQKINKEIFDKYLKFYQNIQFSKNYPMLLINQCDNIDKLTSYNNSEVILDQSNYFCQYYGIIQNYIVLLLKQQNILILLDKNKVDIQICYKQNISIQIQSYQQQQIYQVNNLVAIIVESFRFI